MDNLSTTVENPEFMRVVLLRKGDFSAVSSICSFPTPRYNFFALCNHVSMDDTQDERINAADFVETPINLRPDLTLYGIQEYDVGICEDTYANRTILRKQKMKWVPIFDQNGNSTGQIEVLSPEMETNHALGGLEAKKNILADSRNKNSDYLTGLDLIYAHGVEEMVPPWVLNATRTYIQIEEKRDANPGKSVRPSLADYPGRCRFIKGNQIRCQLWHSGRVSDDGLCRTHLGAKGSDAGVGAVARARQRVAQIAPQMVDVMEEMALHATSEIVRQRAAEQILDRAGVRGGIEVEHKGEIEIKPAKEMLAERLKVLAANTEKQKEFEADIQRALNSGKPEADTSDGDILDAEVIEVEDTEK